MGLISGKCSDLTSKCSDLGFKCSDLPSKCSDLAGGLSKSTVLAKSTASVPAKR
jgi:hypothetical protein